MKVLLTRSELQNAAMLLKLESLGAECVQIPLIEKRGLVGCIPQLNLFLGSIDLEGSRSIDAIIFISPASVEFGAKAILSHFNEFSTRDCPEIFAVGKGTATQLSNSFPSLGEVKFPEEGAGAKALLAMPEFQELDGKKVLIVTGANGKPYLEEQLLNSGATAYRWECYERLKQIGVTDLLAKISPSTQFVFLHSAHAAQFFIESIVSKKFENLSAIVGAKSIKDVLKHAGFNGDVFIAKSPMAKDMLDEFLKKRN